MVTSFVAAFASLAVSAALLVAAPYLLVYSVSHHQLRSSVTLAVLLVVVELLAFARSPLRLAERLSGHEVGSASTTSWRRWLLACLARWPYSALAAASRGELLDSAVTDTDTLQLLWLRGLIPAVAAIATMVLGVLVVAVLPGIGFRGALAAVVLLASDVTVVAVLIRRMSIELVRQGAVREARARRATQRLALMTAHSELSLLGASSIGDVRLEKMARTLRGAERARDRAQIATRLAVAALVTAGVITTAIVSSGGWGVHGRSALVATLVAVSVFDQAAVLVGAVESVIAVSAAAERLDLLDALFSETTLRSHCDDPLELTDVHVTVEGHDVLSGVSLAVARGSKVAITGPNGSGKSTLLRVAAGLEMVTAGRVAVADPAEMAYVPTVPHHLHGPLSRVVSLERGDSEGVLRELGLDHERVDSDGLSAGESQRAAIARALVGTPRVVVLDEPTASLGPLETELVLDALTRRDVTVLVATHDERVIRWCDGELTLDDGAVSSINR